MKTDKQLQTDLITESSWEPSVHAGQIGVEVTESGVTLAGPRCEHVETWNAKTAAQRVSGVKALAVEIDVKLGALGLPMRHERIAVFAEQLLRHAALLCLVLTLPASATLP